MDVEALQTSAKLFEGEHDFLSFAASDPDLTTRSLQITNQDALQGQRPGAIPAWGAAPGYEAEAEGAGGFNPRTMPEESTRASAPDSLPSEHESSRAPISSSAPEGWPLISQTAIRTIFSSTWEQRQTEAGNILIYRVRGSGFLHHMVRNLVGTMLDVGRGRIQPEAIPAILAARNRSAAGPTAPARGLFLHSVEYNEQS
jgi:hypothetical protein